MTHALQVSFRQLVPSEGLIELAAERYRQLRRARPELGECCVSLEMKSGPMAYAVVVVREEGQPGTEGKASHRDPEVALALALEDAQTRLGLRLRLAPPAPAAISYSRPESRAPTFSKLRSAHRTRSRAAQGA